MHFKKITFNLWYFYLPLTGLWLLKFLSGSLWPKDDLLRHAVAYRWGYDYSLPYIETTSSPAYDYYIGFDVIMGWLHRYLGDMSLVLPQLAALTLAFWGLSRFLKEADPWLKVVVLALLVRLCWGRFILGRPSLVCSSLMIFLMAYNDQLPVWLKVALSSVLSTLYHFFFIYLVPLVLFDRKHLISLTFGVVFWLTYSSGQAPAEIYGVAASLNSQNMGVAENKTILVFLLTSWVFFLPLCRNFKHDLKIAFTALFFALSNQVRFLETMVPLGLSFFKFTKIRIPAPVALGATFWLILSIATPSSPLLSFIPEHLPLEARVLSDQMGGMYQLLYKRPDLKVSPSYAYGWTEKGLQEFLKEVLSGTFNCGSNIVHRFDYFLEESLRGKKPECLELIAVEKEKRLWKISPPYRNTIPETPW